MVETIRNDDLNEKKELLEKQLKELNDLKAQILKWKKEWDKDEEIGKLNQEIAKIEKELLMVKFQELKALKEQIVTRENESTVENKKIEEKLSNFENLFTSLEAKIGSLDAENEKAFEKQKKEIEQNFEDLQKEIAELQKQWKQVLWNLREEILAQHVQELLPDHDPQANVNRAKAASSLEDDMKVKEWENGVANWAARMFQKIMGTDNK